MARSFFEPKKSVRAGLIRGDPEPYYSVPEVAASIASMSAPKSLPSVPIPLYGLDFSSR